MSDEEDKGPQRQVTLTKDTRVPVGIAVAFLLICFSVQQYLSSQFTTIKDTLTSVNHKLEKLELIVANGWGRQDMKIWEGELARQNPDLKVPDSWSISDKSGGR
jgi:hypothetical protein